MNDILGHEEFVTAEERNRMLRRLIELGIALSSERDHHRLLELILLETKRIANADGGTLYLMSDDDRSLSFEILRNDTLNVAMGGTRGVEISFPPLALYDEEETPNYTNVATAVALNKMTVNIPNAYETETFDFSGTIKFDESTGYRSMSFLTVPLRPATDQRPDEGKRGRSVQPRDSADHRGADEPGGGRPGQRDAAKGAAPAARLLH